MESYESPAGFRPPTMAEAFARIEDGRIGDAQAASLVALGAELAGEEAPAREVEAGKPRPRQAPALLPQDIAKQIELPETGRERSRVTRHTAQSRLEKDYGRLRKADTVGIQSADADPYQRLYRRLEQRPGPTRANDLIEACLGHPNIQTRVGAAAAHLLRGRRLRPDLVSILVSGLRSTESLARSLGAATLARFDPQNPVLDDLVEPRHPGGAGAPARTSLVVHGTFARNRSWWQPGGDFHEYLRTGPRDDVYGEADRFEWSGGYSDEARELGATQLVAWMAGKGATTADVFAHSHGASISMLATQRGMSARQLILLSCPVMDRYLPDFGRVGQIVSIRVWFDPVILVAGGRQRFDDARITEHVLPGFDHSASHFPQMWRDRRLDQLIGARA